MFIDLYTYINTISTQGDMVRRNIDFPFTRQYIDTPNIHIRLFKLVFGA